MRRPPGRLLRGGLVPRNACKALSGVHLFAIRHVGPDAHQRRPDSSQPPRPRAADAQGDGRRLVLQMYNTGKDKRGDKRERSARFADHPLDGRAAVGGGKEGCHRSAMIPHTPYSLRRRVVIDTSTNTQSRMGFPTWRSTCKPTSAPSSPEEASSCLPCAEEIALEALSCLH